jgi:acetyltransferase-like isoleucine patch superfamily enzyme
MVQDRQSDPRTWYDAIEWFVSTERVAVYFGIRLARALVAPFFELAAVLLIKRLIIGKFVEGGNTSGWSRFQYCLMASLMPDGQLCGTARLLGNHWGGISFVLRCLGAKCGKRVFWPGSGLDVVEYDLLTIEDDLVFGSRSSFLCGDAKANARIRLRAGANVADRCVVLPGVTLGVNGCLGTGSLAPRNHYGKGCVTVGSTQGEAVVLSSGSKELPGAPAPPVAEPIKGFGRVFYPSALGGRQAKAPEKKPTWRVPPVWLYVMYVWAWHTFAAVYRASYILFSLWLVAVPFEGWSSAPDSTFGPAPMEWGSFGLFCAKLFTVYVIVHALLVLDIYAIDVGCKWAIVGRRQPGLFAWETSSYCMRWNLYLTTAVIHKHMLGYLQGSAYLVFYFRAHGAQIGRDVCLYPTGSDPMMTEPDLVSIGDGACINYAFLICHTNSKGVFSLNRIAVGAGATMRSWSRIMAGGVVGTDARMLEHTLGLVGDRVDDGLVWQGWPARDIITTDEYWRRRRHLIRLSRRLTKKYHKELGGVTVGATPSQDEALGARMRAMEARLEQLTRDNSSLRTKLAAVAEHAGSSPDGARAKQPQGPNGTQLVSGKADSTLERPADVEVASELVAVLPPLLAPLRESSLTHRRLRKSELTPSESLDLLMGTSAVTPPFSPRPMLSASPRSLSASLVTRPRLASRSASHQGSRLLIASQLEEARRRDQVTIAITDRPAPPIKATPQTE